MLKPVLAAALLCALTINAEARQRHKTYLAHERCNIDWPCEGVAPSPRGERVVKAMGGFGSAQKVYTPRVVQRSERRASAPRQRTVSRAPEPVQRAATQVVAHPSGCPSRAFCGCGAAVRVFGSPVRSLWLAANWLRFPRAAPAPGMVAARSGHVFVLESHIGGNTWLAYDANSGGRKTRVHARSIAGYAIVNPHGAA